MKYLIILFVLSFPIWGWFIGVWLFDLLFKSTRSFAPKKREYHVHHHHNDNRSVTIINQ